MPQYKNQVTGNLATLSEEYAEATGGDKAWDKIADEAPEEKEMREIQEANEKALEDARANKVDVEVAEPDYTGAVDPITGVPVDPKTGVAPEPAVSKSVSDTGRSAVSKSADNPKGA